MLANKEVLSNSEGVLSINLEQMMTSKHEPKKMLYEMEDNYEEVKGG